MNEQIRITLSPQRLKECSLIKWCARYLGPSSYAKDMKEEKSAEVAVALRLLVFAAISIGYRECILLLAMFWI